MLPTDPEKAASKLLVIIIMIVIIISGSIAGLEITAGPGKSTGTSMTADTSAVQTSVTSISTVSPFTQTTTSSFTSFTSTTSATTTTTKGCTTMGSATGTFESGIWNSRLHGVDYTWGALFKGNGTTPPPDQAFPIIKSLGFNMIRVPLSWNLLEENQSAYLGYLNQVAAEANSTGLYVIYDAHTSGNGAEPGTFFPSSLNATYGTGFQFLTAWWEQNVTYGQQPGWTALWNDFWIPVLKTVNCYNNTLGYELESEPKVEGAPESDLQQYNQVISTEMRALTNRYIAFMGSGEGVNPGYDAQAAPSGISNIVVDAHCYISQASCSNPPAQLAALYNYGKENGITVWVGEWAVYSGCCITESQSNATVQQYVGLFDKYNFSSTYWAWSCSQTTVDNQLLSGSSCQPFWLTYQVSNAQNV